MKPKPCPFCGVTPRAVYYGDIFFEGAFAVRCGHGSCPNICGATIVGHGAEDAINNWNVALESAERIASSTPVLEGIRAHMEWNTEAFKMHFSKRLEWVSFNYDEAKAFRDRLDAWLRDTAAPPPPKPVPLRVVKDEPSDKEPS